MTYLEIVNNVLRRLRENTVTSVTDTTYSAMVGDLVNDAKRQVEDSWDWSALRTTITIPTVDGTQEYSLTGASDRATIIDVQNTTSNWWMQHRSESWGRGQDLIDTQSEASPVYYVSSGLDGSGDAQLKLYPVPDAVYSVDVNVVQRQADLSADGDNLTIPHMPVIWLALALASREKGEVAGQTAAEIFGVAKRILGDAISFDSARNPTDTIWYTV